MYDYIGYHKKALLFSQSHKFIFISRLVESDGNWENITKIREEEDILLNEFGTNFLNLREWLIKRGIDMAVKEGLLNNSYPTIQDISDVDNGYVPTSLRGDGPHLSDIGYKLFSLAVKIKLTELNY